MTYTKDGFLQLLLAAYDGPGSTEEGTFAGDVLRACADGMAQLWSMDIDGLERRAFVSTAVGDWLTAVCADRGVARKEGESDEELRERALRLLSGTPASGNADHYAAWCGQVEGILRVRVLPLSRGNGTVDIVAVGPDGRRPAQEALEQAQAIVDRERPVGADARVLGAVEVPLDGGDMEAVQAAFSAALAEFCRDTALRTPTVSYAKALRLLLDCPGVADVTGFTVNGSGGSLTLEAGAVPVPGALALEEAGA